MAHARNTIIYAPGAGEYDNAELISKICGKESISRTNISYSGGRSHVGYSNKNVSSQDQERNLINPDEVMKLPLDQFILICQGQPPYIGKKNVYYEAPVFKSRLFPAAFTTREGALKAARDTVAKLNGRQWFDSGDTVHRPPDIEDDEVSAMWDKLEGLYDEDETNAPAEPSGGEEDAGDAGYETDADADTDADTGYAPEAVNFLK